MTVNGRSNVGGPLRLGYRPEFSPSSRFVSLAEGEPAALESVVPEPLAENAPKVAASREAGSAPRLEIEFADGCWPEPDPIEEQFPRLNIGFVHQLPCEYCRVVSVGLAGNRVGYHGPWSTL